uniref:(northern house mosquito) hypothetical protein n=1 Tax=Culex pipiens TaxID=7175 RepID=A0A8D8CFJ7_CULPI
MCRYGEDISIVYLYVSSWDFFCNHSTNTLLLTTGYNTLLDKFVLLPFARDAFSIYCKFFSALNKNITHLKKKNAREKGKTTCTTCQKLKILLLLFSLAVSATYTVGKGIRNKFGILSKAHISLY